MCEILGTIGTALAVVATLTLCTALGHAGSEPEMGAGQARVPSGDLKNFGAASLTPEPAALFNGALDGGRLGADWEDDWFEDFERHDDLA
jgi:hypothetical protein